MIEIFYLKLKVILLLFQNKHWICYKNVIKYFQKNHSLIKIKNNVLQKF